MSESLDWINAVGPKLNKREDLQVVVCPRFSALPELHQEIQANHYPIILGSQDLSPFGVGSFTGEEPVELLKELVTMSIIGHSERRTEFGETDEMIKAKSEIARKVGVEPILCVQDVNTPIPQGTSIVAYEPVFAIGTGTPDTPENAELVAGEIKTKHPDMVVLYGGSVTSENCESFVEKDSISGLLIGKASLNADEFLKIVQNCARV